MKKLRTKMLLLILIPILVFFSILIFYISYKTNEMAVENSEKLLNAQGDALTRELRIELEGTLKLVETISHTYEGIIQSDTVPSRKEANLVLKQVLENNSNVLTAWMFWEKNAFDGLDKQFANTVGHDDTGRFIPVWSRSATGYMIVEPFKDYDVPGEVQDNLNYVLDSGSNAIFEPFIKEIDRRKVLSTSIVVPIIVDGKTIGITGVDIALNEMNHLVNNITVYDTGFAGLLSNRGNVLSHPDTKLIGNNYFESEEIKNQDLEQIKTAILAGEKIQNHGYSNILNQEIYRVFTPLSIEGVQTPWSTLVVAPIYEVTKEANQVRKAVLFSSITMMILISIIILFVTIRMVKTIHNVVDYGKMMAVGDFSYKPEKNQINRKDELGDLIRIFSTISKNMSKLIGEVKANTSNVSAVSESVDQEIKNSNTQTKKIDNALKEIASVSEVQMQSAEESAKSMEEMTSGVQRVAQTAASISEATNDMENQTDDGKVTVQKAVEQMNLILHETKGTQEVMQDLNYGTGKIYDFLTLINNISEQTELLALNASIEAARAGEYGKGFAVVANEIRYLADDTKNSASEIDQLVKSIQQSTLKVSNSMEVNLVEVNKGRESIEKVDIAFGEILQEIQNVVKEVEDMSALAQEMSAISEQVAASSQEIASSAEESTNHIQQVVESSDQQQNSMRKMEEKSKKLKQLSYQLNKQLHYFNI